MTVTDLAEVQQKLGAHEQALESGRRAFDQLRDSNAALDSRVKDLEPKRPNYLQLGGFLLAILLAILTAWWKLSAMFSDRPTREELAGQQAQQQLLLQQQAEEIRAIRDRQIEQSVYLQQILKLDKVTP